MKDKLICFMILILFAVTFFVMAKETTTIVCNNVDRTCHLLKENSMLKTKRVLNYTKIGDKNTRKNRGTSFSLTNDGKKTTYSYNKNNINYLACYKKEKNTPDRLNSIRCIKQILNYSASNAAAIPSAIAFAIAF